MLVIKCSACKRKLWKYDKVGQGQVLRCYKDRITKEYNLEYQGENIICLCGKSIGIDKGSSIKMIRNAFIYTGTKRN